MAADTLTSSVDRALHAYQQRSLTRVTVARSVTFLVILAWLALNYGLAVARENAIPLLGFIGLGLVAWGLQRGRDDRRWVPYLFVVLDILLLLYTLLTPGRTYPDGWPWATVLRQPSYLYGLIILVLATLSFRPGLVVWSGCCIVVLWTAVTLWIAWRPGTLHSMADIAAGAGDADYLVRYLDPAYVHLDDAWVRAFVTLILTAILAIAAQRARMLVYQEAEAARQRANLARYVAPTMVDRLARMDRPLGAVRHQDAAVLFADIKGFTSLAEALDAEATMGLLRDFHGRMAGVVFEHGGTLDKFIGDGLMATFGTAEAAPDDAARALACGRAMLASVAAWNRERTAAGAPPLAVGVGIHYGMVTIGDIGGAMRFEFAVIGDTVNVASRLERLTRELDCDLVASDALVARAAAQGHDTAGLEPAGTVELRGRQEPMAVWAGRG